MTVYTFRPIAVALVVAFTLTVVPARASVDEGADTTVPAFGGRKLRQHGERRARFAETLGLTAEQKSHIDQVRQANREARRTAHAALAAKRTALRDAMLANPDDRSAIDRATSEMNDARAEAQRTGLEMQRQIFATLTPEQREKFRAMLQERKGRRNRAR
jgi:Spy/CpxP family protein refolding chaperone